MMEQLLIWGLLAVCAGLALYLLAVKRQLRMMRAELQRTRDSGYDRQLTVSLFDRDVTALAAELNRNLDFQHQLKLSAESAERHLKQSISDIAHDLRTPMTVIKGNLQLLAWEEALSPRGRSYLSTCREKAEVLKNMADDFFELSVLESDLSPVPLHRVNAVKLLMQFIADHEAVIRLHRLEPEIVFPERSAYLMADEQLLLRMLGNLLNNIVKYAQGSFQLRLEPAGETCSIVFANAVDKVHMIEPERLFDRSYRADRARSGGGAGLGLYIVRLLADKQGASAEAELTDGLLTVRLIFRSGEQRIDMG